jgi:hypothetical protein
MQKDYSEPGFTKKNLIDTGNFDTPVGGCRDFLPSVINFPPFRANKSRSVCGFCCSVPAASRLRGAQQGMPFLRNKKSRCRRIFLLIRQSSNLNSSDPEEYENIIFLS